jgi:hypothetical protein
MNAVTTNAVEPITGEPPSSNATAAASPAHPAVAAQRGYGWREGDGLGRGFGCCLDIRAPRTTWSTTRVTSASLVRSWCGTARAASTSPARPPSLDGST